MHTVTRLIIFTALIAAINLAIAAPCKIATIDKEHLHAISKEQFRKQAFGGKPSADFKLSRSLAGSKVYNRSSDKLAIADIKLDTIQYHFSNDYGFYLADITGSGKSTVEQLNAALELKYGKPDYIRPADDGSTTHIWQRGEKLITHKFMLKQEFTSTLHISAREIEDAVEDYNKCVANEKLRKALENDL